MIEIKLTKEDNFLPVKETLTRMGIANNKDKKLYQSCHILQKRGLFYIVHFKEMMELDGKKVTLTEEDAARTYSIAKMLESWDLLTVVDEQDDLEIVNNFRVITFRQKSEWTLVPKYTIGS